MTETIETRHSQDVGNIIALEHVNFQIDRQDWATLFYVTGLGLTRDPYLMVGLENMWINVGAQQFHLPTRTPQQVLRGRVGLVLPDLDALAARLDEIAPQLSDTRFTFTRNGDRVDVTCPWGNHIRCHAPSDEPRAIRLGMPYVEFDVPVGSAAGIARFYSRVMGAPGEVENDAGSAVASITVGDGQRLRFRETT
ncbi:MAG: hypothetical protein KDK91_12755, partial [Gammaproteobacteria bacterium]|nr:hypothetical protein [Gammaproteobacteria bacterium]